MATTTTSAAGSSPAADQPSSSSSPQASLVGSVTEYVKAYMARYDGSHDFQHIRRVLALALHILDRLPPSSTSPPLDRHVVVLAALLHDVGDKKYLRPGEDGTTQVRDVLLAQGASAALADKVPAVCAGVSFSSEVRDPERVRTLIAAHPELAVVQDADRLDAIGAVGIGRVFTFSGAHGRAGDGASMEESIRHFHEKLLRIGDMMKTDVGREMAEERTRRMRTFLSWWDDEEELSLSPALLPPQSGF